MSSAVAGNQFFTHVEDAAKHFTNLNTSDLDVADNATVDGNLTVNGAVNFPLGVLVPTTLTAVADADINPAVANTFYQVGPITANRAVTMPAGTTAGQVIVFQLIGANGNNNDLVITCPANLSAGSTLTAAAAGTANVGAVAGANSVLTFAGDTNGGGGIGSQATFISDGTSWRCTAVGVLQGNGSVADSSAFS